MTDCKDCLSNDICCLDDRPRQNCFFFSETEESRIRNSMEYKQGRLDAIDFVVRQIIYPLLNEYDIQLWKNIEYIELADKWVEFVGKYKSDDETIISELEKWLLEQLKEQS